MDDLNNSVKWQKKLLRQGQWYEEAREAQRAHWAQEATTAKGLFLLNGGSIVAMVTYLSRANANAGNIIINPRFAVIFFIFGLFLAVAHGVYHSMHLHTYMKRAFKKSDELFLQINPDNGSDFGGDVKMDSLFLNINYFFALFSSAAFVVGAGFALGLFY